MPAGEERDGVPLTNLDQPLFDGAGATKRDLVDYLDAVSDRILPELRDRPLSVIRVHRGQDAFMQKNVPKYTPEWVPTVALWAEASKREVAYALCNDRRTLLWFANQRAVEYHPTLVRRDRLDRATHLVLDLDPPEGSGFPIVVAAARLVRQVLTDAGLESAVKTSGAKGLHVIVPIDDEADARGGRGGDAGDRVARRGPGPEPRDDRVHEGEPRREGVRRLDPRRRGDRRRRVQPSRARRARPCRIPVGWDAPRRRRARRLHGAHGDRAARRRDPWAAQLPEPQHLPDELVEEGHTIPVARVQAMHEGKRRARERR